VVRDAPSGSRKAETALGVPRFVAFRVTTQLAPVPELYSR
jgi:hypothetical protein